MYGNAKFLVRTCYLLDRELRHEVYRILENEIPILNLTMLIMKTKNGLWYMLMLVCSVAFTACDDDDDGLKTQGS